jgi:hypothetical protein
MILANFLVLRVAACYTASAVAGDPLLGGVLMDLKSFLASFVRVIIALSPIVIGLFFIWVAYRVAFELRRIEARLGEIRDRLPEPPKPTAAN